MGCLCLILRCFFNNNFAKMRDVNQFKGQVIIKGEISYNSDNSGMVHGKY